MTSVTRDLSGAFAFLDSALEMLTHPGELYERADDEQRRLLNQAIFEKFLVDDDEVTGAVLKAPFAELAAAHELFLGEPDVRSDRIDKGATPKGDSLSEYLLLAGIYFADGSSSPDLVDLRQECSNLRENLQRLLRAQPV